LESTVTAICFILWEIVSRPEVFEKVLKELNEAFPTWKDVGLLQLEKLPYFNAAIYEGMRYDLFLVQFTQRRMHPPVPQPVPRVVPTGGAVLNGHFLPAGVITLFRKPSNDRLLPAFRPTPLPETLKCFRTRMSILLLVGWAKTRKNSGIICSSSLVFPSVISTYS
jgi:hypothetical protein